MSSHSVRRVGNRFLIDFVSNAGPCYGLLHPNPPAIEEYRYMGIHARILRSGDPAAADLRRDGSATRLRPLYALDLTAAATLPKRPGARC